MRKILIASIITLTFLFPIISFAQTDFQVPQNVELKTKEDYAKYEPSVIDAAKWLESTDLDKEEGKRTQVNTFLMKWITGSPTVNVLINNQLSKIYKSNNALLMLYMASYTSNVIETKNYSTTAAPIKAGLLSIMKVYKKGIAISNSKEMDKIIKLTDQELDEYIAKKFK